jgi:hypothetical protein
VIQFESVTKAAGRPPGDDLLVCRLIVTRNLHSEVLIVPDGAGFQLPGAKIPKWERAAPHLISQVSDRWGVKAIVLFYVQPESVECEGTKVHSYVLEAIDANAILTNGARWIAAAELHNGQFHADDIALQRALDQASTFDSGAFAGAFVRPCWLNELDSWVQAQLLVRGWRRTGEWAQYNIGPWFTLLRCATSGPNVWFKAVGEPNLKEYAITRTLARSQSAYTPEILATRGDWHGWLAIEAPGQPLDHLGEIAGWRCAAQSLAKLQLESLRSADSLLAAGCKDLRSERIATLICPLFDRIADLMDQQPASPPRILTRDDLNLVADRLQEACARLQRHSLPATLGHADLNPGNVIVNGERAVFLDWAEATISHPFFTFEYLIALLRRLRPDLEGWVEQLREAYSTPWREFYSEEEMRRAFEATPLLAVLAFAVGCTDWQDDGRNISPPMAKLMRALARRMFREALEGDKFGI